VKRQDQKMSQTMRVVRTWEERLNVVEFRDMGLAMVPGVPHQNTRKNTPITRTKCAINLLNHVILTMQLLQFEEGSLVITLI
jgi:hypothetical protein